ncbi:hypothetical protein CXF95_05885 [Paraglaciecola sp. MB-3u-78]|nr:hypothetical protein CXF95_05885 [Paraglaciecola sp. MB-3u-78]
MQAGKLLGFFNWADAAKLMNNAHIEVFGQTIEYKKAPLHTVILATVCPLGIVKYIHVFHRFATMLNFACPQKVAGAT